VATYIGIGALVGAAGLQVLGPATWAGVVLAGVAALLLGLDPRFGPLGAGLIALLALPYGRAADGVMVQLAGLPVRPADGAIAVAVLATIVRFRSFAIRDRWPVYLLAVFMALGLMALAIGLAVGNDIRDVGRDVRWWVLYGALGLAVVIGSTRAQLFSSFRVGATLFGLIVVAATVLPAFEGGLKESVLKYDQGLLRLQFGNSSFLLPVIGYVTFAVLQRPRWTDLALLGLLSGALALSLTRTSILAALGMVGLLIVAAYLWPELHGRRPRLTNAVLVVVTIAVAGAAAIGLDVVSTPRPGGTGAVPGVAESPIDRILFQSEPTNLGATVSESGGRFTSYRNAVDLIATSPIVGHGMGSLVAVPFAYDPTRAWTVEKQPGVDNAYLTFAMKAGVLGVLVFVLLLVLVLWRVLRDRDERAWLLPAWAAILVLTMTQSFAVSNYGPFALALFVGLSIRGYPASIGSTAASHE
jgi:O-antigen ligase